MATSPTISAFFFFNDTATTEIYTLSLHDALPISPGSLWDAPPGRPLDLPLGGSGDGGGRSGGPAEDGRVEVGGALRRRAGAASIPGAGAAGVAGRAGPRALPLLAQERGGRVIRKREPRWQSAAERARVAAELIEA